MITTLGSRIKSAREFRGLTQDDLAGMIQTGPSLVSKWESGKVAPRVKTIQKVASKLGVDTRWLQYGEGAGPTRGGCDPYLGAVKYTRNLTPVPPPPPPEYSQERAREQAAEDIRGMAQKLDRAVSVMDGAVTTSGLNEASRKAFLDEINAVAAQLNQIKSIVILPGMNIGTYLDLFPRIAEAEGAFAPEGLTDEKRAQIVAILADEYSRTGVPPTDSTIENLIKLSRA